MRSEKQYISSEYIARLNASPFFIVVNYRGLAVRHFNELRKRLTKAGAEVHVIKNSIFKRSVQAAAGVELPAELTGQLAMVTGRQDISTAAKVLKAFQAEFEKPKIQFGYLDKQRLEMAEIITLAELPPLEVLRGKIMGAINAPASRLVQVLNAPGQQLVRALQARVEKGA